MPLQTMQQGIAAIQAGNRAEGRRLLRIALGNETVQGNLRAVGLMWLAETTDDRAEKIQYMQEAIAADPQNPDPRNRLAILLQPPPPSVPTPMQTSTQTGLNYAVTDTGQFAAFQAGDTGPFAAFPVSDTGQFAAYQPTPTPQPQPGVNWSGYTPQVNPYQPVVNPAPQYSPPYGLPAQPSNYMPNANPYGSANPSQPPAGVGYAVTPTSNMMYRAIGVVGGQNGTGSGFFVTKDGLVATTRFVIGGVTDVTIELEPGLSVPGRVVRGFPEIDLVLLRANVRVTELLPATPLPSVPDQAVLNAASYTGRAMSGTRRETRRSLKLEWIPTTIDRLSIVDAGGNPVFDDHNYLIGMLTRNTARTNNYVFALHISAIHAAVQTYLHETQIDPRRAYCPCCGFASRAPSIGGFYCESCGAVLPYAVESRRFPNPQTMALYGDTAPTACPHCKARAGFYNNVCLRCGQSNKPKVRVGR